MIDCPLDRTWETLLKASINSIVYAAFIGIRRGFSKVNVKLMLSQ